MPLTLFWLAMFLTIFVAVGGLAMLLTLMPQPFSFTTFP